MDRCAGVVPGMVPDASQARPAATAAGAHGEVLRSTLVPARYRARDPAGTATRRPGAHGRSAMPSLSSGGTAGAGRAGSGRPGGQDQDSGGDGGPGSAHG